MHVIINQNSSNLNKKVIFQFPFLFNQYFNRTNSQNKTALSLITLLKPYFTAAYSCPKGEVYMAKGPVPAPTCLEKNPTQTGTARGCFCPEGQLLQDDQCVQDDQCRCLHEGVFYNVRHSITFSHYQLYLSKSWMKNVSIDLTKVVKLRASQR